MIVDLGCGGTKRGDIGIDITSEGTHADLIANLGFDPIPLEDDFADEVICHHFIEHVPFAVWHQVILPRHIIWKRRLPMVYLFNEIYRILKPDGLLKVTIPIVGLGNLFVQAGFQDPTHVSFWIPETVNYFSGDYYSFHDIYGHTSRFEKKRIDVKNGWFMEFDLRAVKNLPADAPYALKYE
jgi:SAM-dependent methyltransferase